MPTARIAAVAPGSPADTAGVAAGDELLSLNGETLRDVIRYQLQSDEACVDLEIRRGGLERHVVIEKEAGEPLGLGLTSPVFDRVRTCDNHCPFCFIYQLPRGMRPSLFVKDDDYRLSFLYGNFTTLTRFTEADLERVVSEQLGPLYVSIHATDPELRARLLRNRRGATSLRWLHALLDAGIEVHGQIVACPGLNDGPALDDTLLGILDRFPALASLGVVPLGVSAHNREPDLRPHTAFEASETIDMVERWQHRFLDVLGRRLVHAADELYLLAGRPFPPLDAYDDLPQHENGIGMAATFIHEVEASLRGEPVRGVGTRSGFFASVDGAGPSGYRAPRSETTVAAPDRRARPVAIVTGAYGDQVIAPLLPALGEAARVPVRTLRVENRFFGGNIGVTGLLTGADLRRVLADEPAGERYLLPDVTLSEGRFLDDLTPAELGHSVEVIGSDGASLVAALR
jgi:putative radical SAM enzyme (TIGR03279 family)